MGRNPLARTLRGEPIVLFRKIDGEVAAMADACPHRPAPLSIGVVVGHTRVPEGAPDHCDVFLTDDGKALGHQMTPCCSRAKSPLLVPDL